MAVLCRWLLVWIVLFAGGLPRLVASEENTAFNNATRDFLGNSFERADAEFGAFIQTYTNSSRLADAILYQAEARLKLGQPAGALELLLAHLPQAGKWTDPYLYYLGEAYALSGDYRRAGDTFGQLLQRFPASTNGLNAAVKQAAACSQLGEWARVIELLEQTNGVFQTAVRTHPTNASTQRGLLLLSEAWLRRADAPQHFAAAEAALQPLAKLALPPVIDWDRQDLLCRILLASGRTNEALLNSTNLLSAAAQAGSRERQARSHDFRAGVLEGLGRLDEAITAYTNNLGEGVPDELRRRALLQSTTLLLQQDRIANAFQTLEKFVSQYSNAPAADMALLTLGELHLRQFILANGSNALDTLPVNGAGPTNAIAHFQAVVQRFPQSVLSPKAQLDLGWCYWLQGNLTNAQTHFEAAAQLLAPSAEQAIAYFKLADTQGRLGAFGRALANYKVVLDKLATLPAARAALEEPALYQIVHTGLAAGDLAAATNAMATLLERFPEGYHTAPAVLLSSQALGQQGDPARARGILLEFVARATNAPSLPLVQLALARTWEEEGNWTNALRHYRQVPPNCPNADLRAEAAFGAAQATWRAGELTNALALYTNFVAGFSTHPKAPLAQLWVGDYYFNQSHFSAAELTYQQLCENTNWRTSELAYRARMMAGRAAFQQKLWNNAVTDFTNLTGIVNCPSNLWVEAMFAYGDCELSQLAKERNDPANTNHLSQAVRIFSGIGERYPTGPQALLALVQKANTLVQWAQYSGDTLYYTNALSLYQQLLTNQTADVPLRSMAEMGLYVALKMQADQKSGPEQTALLLQALDHCLNVARGTLLGPGEKGDRYWTLLAADKAIDLAASLQRWDEARSLCQQIAKDYPALEARYQEREKTLALRQSNLTRN